LFILIELSFKFMGWQRCISQTAPFRGGEERKGERRRGEERGEERGRMNEFVEESAELAARYLFPQ
jgi:hypothetical protein